LHSRKDGQGRGAVDRPKWKQEGLSALLEVGGGPSILFDLHRTSLDSSIIKLVVVDISLALRF
jgi:hypothetical protein